MSMFLQVVRFPLSLVYMYILSGECFWNSQNCAQNRRPIAIEN